MRKRLICLTLALMFVLSGVLCGCSESSDTSGTTVTEEESSARPTVSINMWLITDEKTTPEAEALVEEAINAITESRFTTHVDLVFYTADKYEDALTEKFTSIRKYRAEQEEIEKQRKEDAKNKVTETTAAASGDESATTEETTAETEVNELGMKVLKYPEISESQLDIILVQGKKKLDLLVSENNLSMLDDELNSSSKVLKDYIHPVLLDNVKLDKITYSIPNNHTIGEYTYLLINKAMADKYYIDTDSISSLTDCETLITEIGRKEAGIAPMLAYTEPTNIYYWNDAGERLALASYVATKAGLGTRTIMRNVFATAQYTNQVSLMKLCEQNGWFANNDASEKNFGVGVIKGDSKAVEQYKDEYEIKVLEYPTATDEDVFGSMFAVSAYTANLQRSMEVITFMNTDAQFKNLLQYGIEGVHYEFDDDGYFVRLNDDYEMNNIDTGNVFLSYVEGGAENADIWERGKKANLDAVASPYLGFGDPWYGHEMEYADAKRVSEEYFERMDACTTRAQVDAFFADAKTEILTRNEIEWPLLVNSGEGTPYENYSIWFEKNWPSET